MRIAPTPMVLKTMEAQVRRHLPPPPTFLAFSMSFRFLTTTIPEVLWNNYYQSKINLYIKFEKSIDFKLFYILNLPLSLTSPWCCLLEDVDAISNVFKWPTNKMFFTYYSTPIWRHFQNLTFKIQTIQNCFWSSILGPTFQTNNNHLYVWNWISFFIFLFLCTFISW